MQVGRAKLGSKAENGKVQREAENTGKQRHKLKTKKILNMKTNIKRENEALKKTTDHGGLNLWGIKVSSRNIRPLITLRLPFYWQVNSKWKWLKPAFLLVLCIFCSYRRWTKIREIINQLAHLNLKLTWSVLNFLLFRFAPLLILHRFYNIWFNMFVNEIWGHVLLWVQNLGIKNDSYFKTQSP